MPIIDIFSRRKRRAEQSGPDVYQYDAIPETLRVQICRIFNKSMGTYQSYIQHGYPWTLLREITAQELGKMTLANQHNPQEDCLYFLQTEQDVEHWLDLVELGIRTIDGICRNYGPNDHESRDITQTPDDAIEEVNFRFRDAGLGYQYENGQIIRIDNQLLHAEVTKPALQLLSDSRFKGAEDEFLKAHEHYRVRNYKDCNTNALNAFESTLKSICDLKGWRYNASKDVASELIKIVRNEKLLPDYLDRSFDQLIATLKSGLPEVRNKAGGHGQGARPKQTPDYIAAYALHLTAANIVLLIRAFQATENK